MPDFPDAGAIRFRKIRDAGSVLNATLAFIRRNARELLGSYLAIVGPLAVAAGIASVLFVARNQSVFSDPEAIIDDPTLFLGPAYLSSLVLSLLTFVVAQAAAGGYVRLYRQGLAGTVTPAVLWDETRSLIAPVLGVSLLACAGFLGAALVNVIPCLGQIAFLALVVWASPIVSVAFVSRVLDTDSAGAAWSRARALVDDSWGFAFGALFLAALVLLLVSFVISVIGMAFGSVLGLGFALDPADLAQSMSVGMAVIQTLTSVLTYAVYLVPFLAAYFVHGRLAEELDGTGLAQDLDSLEGLSEARFDAGGYDRPASTRPAPDEPAPDGPAPDTPASDEPPSDTPGGFRGGGFGA